MIEISLGRNHGSLGHRLIRSGMMLRRSGTQVATFRAAGSLQKMLGAKAIRNHGMSIHQKEFIQSRGVSKRIGKLRMAGITKHLDVDSIGNSEPNSGSR